MNYKNASRSHARAAPGRSRLHQKNPNHWASLAAAGGEGKDGAPLFFFFTRRGGVVGSRIVWRGTRSGEAAASCGDGAADRGGGAADDALGPAGPERLRLLRPCDRLVLLSAAARLVVVLAGVVARVAFVLPASSGGSGGR